MRYAKGNNMPMQAPLIPDPFVPYHCPDNAMAYTVCRGEEEKIRALLEPTYFEYVDDRYMVEISDFSNCDKVPYMDAAIVLPVRYKDVLGGCYVFECENDDAAIAAGRDLWGYPKKYAKITLEAGSRGVVGSVVRRGETLCRIELDLDAPCETPSLRLTPHLNTHILPRSDGPGILMSRVIARDTSPDFETKSSVSCRARVELKSTREDPWDALGLVEVLGGGWIVGDFHATDENGWGRVLDTYMGA